MDVVDTLRHETKLLERDLSVEDREAQLIERLREIYTAQGIEVFLMSRKKTGSLPRPISIVANGGVL